MCTRRGRNVNARDRGTEQDQLDKVKKKMGKEMELPPSPSDMDYHTIKETNGG